MPKLITRCLSSDYQTVIDDHADNDRGELASQEFVKALHSASYIMPHSSDPESSYRPAVGLYLAEDTQPTFFYVTDYQGSFGLDAKSSAQTQFDVDDLVDLTDGNATIAEIQSQNAVQQKRLSAGIKITFALALLIVLYLAWSNFS